MQRLASNERLRVNGSKDRSVEANVLKYWRMGAKWKLNDGNWRSEVIFRGESMFVLELRSMCS